MEALHWQIAHASLRGRSHEADGKPCQDAHKIVMINEECGVAVVADGAGSHENSQLGSSFVVRSAAERFVELVRLNTWYKVNIMPSASEWKGSATAIFKQVHDELSQYAISEGIDVRSLGCTVIVLVFSPYGILTAHIGDGRAAYRNVGGEWKASMTPFKGEEVGQTVFITSDIWNKTDNYVECTVFNDKVDCFTLMSDGCERSAFRCYVKDELEERYFDPNEPFIPFFTPIVKNIKKMRQDKLPQDNVNRIWSDFLLDGLPALTTEQDDKTMIMGVLTCN
jgi:hypothetical protein